MIFQTYYFFGQPQLRDRNREAPEKGRIDGRQESREGEIWKKVLYRNMFIKIYKWIVRMTNLKKFSHFQQIQ